MTKLRVHELAKELNIDNKGLIERIEKLGFTVKNHMSPLSDSAVLKIRQQFSEARLGAEKVEEKRIGREVIRRRKKIDAQPEPEAPQAETAEEIPFETVAEVVETPPVEVPPQFDVQSGVPAEPPELPSETGPPLAEPVEAVEAKEVIVDKAKTAAHPERKYEPARIVRPAPVKPEPVVAQPAVAEELKPAAKAQPGRPVQAPPVAPKPVGTRPAETVPDTATSQEALPKTSAATEEEEEDDDKRKKGKKRRRKKAKREEPARIIKLPELMGEETEEEPEPDLRNWPPVLSPRVPKLSIRLSRSRNAKNPKRRKKPNRADARKSFRKRTFTRKKSLPPRTTGAGAGRADRLSKSRQNLSRRPPRLAASA